MTVSLNGFAQSKTGSSTKIEETAIVYIGSSETSGSSDAVIVGEVALAHTRQFLPLDDNGNISQKDNLSKQVDQLFRNISRALKPAGADINKIVKLNVFLKRADLISQVQPLISRKFGQKKKPSITFAAGDLSHPEALIAIDAIAVSDLGSVKMVQLSGFRDSMGQAAIAILPKGPVVYVSGQASKGELAEATRSTLKQLEETLISLGLNRKDIVQIKSFLSPMSSLNIVEKEFIEFFKGEKIPPLVFVDWISTDPVIEIELIAFSPLTKGKVEQVDYITPMGMTSSPVYSKVSRLNYGKKVYLSGIYGLSSVKTDSVVNKVFGLMENVLNASGSDFKNLLKATYYISNDQYSKSLADIRPRFYDPKRPPAASKAMLKGIGINGQGISVDMIGTIKE